jgi:hypothetical protein
MTKIVLAWPTIYDTNSCPHHRTLQSSPTIGGVQLRKFGEDTKLILIRSGQTERPDGVRGLLWNTADMSACVGFTGTCHWRSFPCVTNRCTVEHAPNSYSTLPCLDGFNRLRIRIVPLNRFELPLSNPAVSGQAPTESGQLGKSMELIHVSEVRNSQSSASRTPLVAEVSCIDAEGMFHWSASAVTC